MFGIEFLLVGGHTNYVCWSDAPFNIASGPERSAQDLEMN